MIFNSYAEQKEELAGIRLVSCGHVFAKPNREIYRPIGREDWLLFYVAKEEETFFLNDTVIAKAGSFIIFAPKEKQHHMYQGNKTAEFYYVHFRCDTLPISLETSRVYSLMPQQHYCSLFEEIIDEPLQKKAHYEALCISRLLYIMALIQRDTAENDNSAHSRWKTVEFAIQHMNKYCDSSLKLENYADMCRMSKYHFLRVFKQVTGSTPLDYRNRIRIEHAKELLENGYLTVSEISESLGYNSPAYFCDAFKKMIGCSPIEYRNGKKELPI